MTDLERFAATVLNAVDAAGLRPDAELPVAGLLDRVAPYKLIRRTLALDTVEDYESMVLRLISEESTLVTVTPADAAEMARATLASRVPDLDVLRLLRSAALTFTDDALSRLQGVRVLPQPAAPSEATESPEEDRVFPIRRGMEVADATRVVSREAAPRCWSCDAALPVDRVVNFCVACGADQRARRCAACGASVERDWKHCPDCGSSL